ncbi:possible oxidoreductase [Lachnospiraceae bacterium KM106-2]|nr:possible oxidoreductase [Lachnospiraceae bacterium KM106-2]
MKIAIIGTSKITERFLEVVRKVPDLEPVAVVSRKRETGEAYANKHGLKKVVTSIEELTKEDTIDAVYIASPNCCHASQAIQLLNSKKHVLCEKPIASSYEEVQAMVDAARENQVVLLEAMRSVFDPGFDKIEELLPKLGKIRRIHFTFGKISSRYDNFKKGIIENAFNPALSNAAVMDIGVYCIHPLVRLFGRPARISAQSVFLENGMEGAGTAILNYGDMIGEVQYSKITDEYGMSQIQGEEATMLIDSISDTRTIEVIHRNGVKETYLIEKEKNNMYYEVATFVKLIEKQQVEHSFLRSSLDEMAVMDEIRKQAGIHFE